MNKEELKAGILTIIKELEAEAKKHPHSKIEATTTEISKKLFGEGNDPHQNKTHPLLVKLRNEGKIIGTEHRKGGKQPGSPWMLLK